MARLQSITMPIDPQINDSQLRNFQRKAKQAAGNSTDYLSQAFTKWAKQTEQLFKKAFDFTNYFKGIANKLNTLIDFDFLLTGVQKLKSAIGTATSQIWDSFKGASKGFESLIKKGKSTLKQFGQLVGKQFAFDMQGPMKQLVNWFKKNRKQINRSLTSLARNIGHLFDSFAKGLIGVVKVGKTFFEWFNKLPNSIKGTTYAIMAMWAVLKAGPIGVLSAIVQFAGLLIDDYKTYVKRMQGQDVGKSSLDGLWQLIYDPSGKGLNSDKIKEISGTVMSKIFEGASNWLDTAGPQIATFLTQLTNTISDLMITAANALSGSGQSGVDDSFKKFGESLGRFLSTLLITAIQSMGTLGGAVVQSIGMAVGNIGQTEWEKQFGTDFEQNSFADALGSFLMISLFTGNPTKGLVAAIVSFFIKAFTPATDQISDGKSNDLGSQAVKFGTAVAEFLCGGLSKIQLFSQAMTGSIVTFLGNLFSTFTGKGDQNLSEGAKEGLSNLISGFITGAGTYLLSHGNTALSIGTAFVGFFGDAISSAWDQAWDTSETGEKTFNPEKFKKKFLSNSGETLKNLGSVILSIVDIAIAGIDWVSGSIDTVVAGIATMIYPSFGQLTTQQIIDKMGGESALGGIKSVIGGVITTALTGGNATIGIAGALVTLLLNQFTDAKKEVAEDKTFEQLDSTQWAAIIEKMFTGAADAVLSISTFTDGIVIAIAKMIAPTFGEVTDEKIISQMGGESGLNAIKSAVAGVITTALTGGNVPLGIASSLVTLLFEQFNNAKEEVVGGESLDEITEDEWNDIINNALGGVSEVGQTVLTWIRGIILGVTNWWKTGGKQQFNEKLEPIKKAFDELWNGNEETGFSGLKAIFGDVWNDVSNGFVTMISSLWEKVKGPVNNLAQNIALAIYNSLPQGLIKQLWGDAPRAVNKNEDGTFTFSHGNQSVTMQDSKIGSSDVDMSQYMAEHKEDFSVELVDGKPQLKTDIFGSFDSSGWNEYDMKQVNELYSYLLSKGSFESIQQLRGIVESAYGQRLQDVPQRITQAFGNIWAAITGQDTDVMKDIYEVFGNPAQLTQETSDTPTSKSHKTSTSSTYSKQERKRLSKKAPKEKVITEKVTKNSNDSSQSASAIHIFGNTNTAREKGESKVTQTNSQMMLGNLKQTLSRVISVQSAVNTASSAISSSIDKLNVKTQLDKMDTALENLNSTLKSLDTTISQLGKSSEGGRFERLFATTVAQDGPQYIIPITKTERAVSLIQQMVSQMGITAKNAVADALGISTDISTIGGSMMSGIGIGGSNGLNIVYNNNVSAPVTINVNSSGASATAIGQQVYSSTQRALLKTLKSAIG